MAFLIGIFSLAFCATGYAEIFQGVNYKIIEKSSLKNIKYSVEIELSKKVSEQYLRSLALQIQKKAPQEFERIFILYYLPGMTPGAGAWATSHFNPNLEVKILGLTIGEEEVLKSQPNNVSNNVIGEWIDETPYIAGKYTFLKRNGKILMVIKFKDGSTLEREMLQFERSGNLAYREQGDNDFGEYYVIESNGNLSAYDNEGFRTIMSQVKK